MARTAVREPLLAPDPLEDRSYAEALAAAGAYRDRKRGVVHEMPYGPAFKRNGRWVQQTKTFPVATSAAEAREKTKQTGERHDWYSDGSECPKCRELIVGWCLGGRKFQAEHDHVTQYDPTVYGEREVEAPPSDDDDAPEDSDGQ
jgi:hypothetical protein